MQPVGVSVRNLDNDAAGHPRSLIPRPGDERGRRRRHVHRRAHQPAGSRRLLAITSNDPGEEPSRQQPDLRAEQLERAQTVTVTGVDDPVDDGDVTYTIRIEAAGSRP